MMWKALVRANSREADKQGLIHQSNSRCMYKTINHFTVCKVNWNIWWQWQVQDITILITKRITITNGPCYANEYIAMLCIWSSITTGVTLCRDGGSILMLRDASATISDCCATDNTMQIQRKFNTNTTQLKARNGAIICYSPPLSVALPWFCSVSLASLNRVTPRRGWTAHWEMSREYIFANYKMCLSKIW